MARIRTIKPDFFRHVALRRAELETKLPLRLAFIALWTAADREGRFKWDPEQLQVDCFPLDNLDFSHVLDALNTRGFILNYGPSLEYGAIPTWRKHQFINNKEAVSAIPEPPQGEIDACLTRASRKFTDGVKEGKGREVSIKVKIKKTNPAPVGADGFGNFWTLYPKKVAKGDAAKAWNRINPDADLQLKITAALEAARSSVEWLKDSGQFIPHPATWLNGERWEDSLKVDRPAPRRFVSTGIKCADCGKGITGKSEDTWDCCGKKRCWTCTKAHGDHPAAGDEQAVAS